MFRIGCSCSGISKAVNVGSVSPEQEEDGRLEDPPVRGAGYEPPSRRAKRSS